MGRNREALIEKYGSYEAYLEHMREIAALGGKNGKGGGFASTDVGSDGLTGRERAALAGKKGGKRRGKK